MRKRLKLSLYQRWQPDGQAEWRALPAAERNGYAWERLHLPGSIPADQLLLLSQHGLLPDPAPFAEEQLSEPITIRLTKGQRERLLADAEKLGVGLNEALRRALG
jgi:hypothetical protein